MNEEKLIKIWQSSANQVRFDIEGAKLVTDVQADPKRFDSFVDKRDLGTIIPAMILIPIILYDAYTSTLIQAKIVQILLAFWLVFVIIKIQQAKKSKPAAISESYFQYLVKTREYLYNQKKLYIRVVYWFILPFVILMIAYALAPVFWMRQSIGPSIFYYVFSSICVLAGVRIYHRSKNEFNKEVRPRIEKVDQLIKAIEK
jgi:hypothetical protein